MARQFLKLARDIYRDPKLRRALPDDGDKWLWVGLLCLAGEADKPGVITEDRIDIAERLDVSVDDLNRVVETLSAIPRPPVTSGQRDEIIITNWRAHQYNPSDSAEETRERKRAQREREAQEQAQNLSSDEEMSRCHDVTPHVTTEEKRREESINPPSPPDGGKPAKPVKAPKEPRASAAVEMPEGFRPSDSTRKWIKAKFPNATTAALKTQWELFRTHHAAKGSKFKDWNAAFRSWLLKAEAFGHLDPRRDPAAPVMMRPDDPGAMLNGVWMRRLDAPTPVTQ